MNKNKGYYFGRYDVFTSKYSGPDFSKRCFVFPGQGSAFPGMLKSEYFDFKIIQEKILLADSLVRKFNLPKISDYILNPSRLKEKTLSVTTNLVLFTLELALFDIFISFKIIPKIVTGHSFGEYAALVASGIISFEEMINIVYYRDLFCPPANSLGFMVAINTNVKKIKSVLKKRNYYISNINSPRQTVISVSKDAIIEIVRILESEKLRHKILYNVPQPYHSPYLKDVKKKIEQYLQVKKFSFKKPEIPLFSSVLNKLIDKDNFKKEDVTKILINQIITPVDFINQIKTINNLGCFNFLELGPKKLFSVFIEDIMTDAGQEVKTDFALNFLQKEKKAVFKFVSSGNNELFSLIKNTIGEITGYETQKISLEDRFQEDLGIDSIKKADILLTILNKLNIYTDDNFNTSEFVNIKDVIFYLEKTEKTGRTKKETFMKLNWPEKETNFKRYIFAPIKKPLNDYYWNDERKDKIFLLNIADIFKNKDILLKEIIYFLKGKETEKERLNIIIRADSVEFNFNKIFLIFGFFREFLNIIERKNFNLVLLSSDNLSGRGMNPYFYCLSSFLKSLKKELPEIFFKHVHFDNIQNNKAALDIVLKEIHEPFTIDVFYKNGERFTFAPKLIERRKKPDLNKKSVILAIGGAKGITFSLVKNISRKYKPTIYLVGRSPKEDKLICVNIAELKKENPKIYYESLDACDIKSMEKLFLKIKKKHKKIDLVLNGAGVVRIGFLKNKTNEDINYEFNNKVLPAFNILSLSSKYKPKRIINFSSVISKYGSAGQSIYTSANELVSRLTAEYNNAVAIHWPPWNGIGMTSDKGVSQKLNEYGVSLLKPEKADELFVSDLSFFNNEPIYYLGDSDDLLYGFTLNNLNQYKSLIGKILDPFNISASKLVFKKLFDLSKDNYLKDHKIKDICYVPAAVGIGMFLCLGNMYFKKFPILKNIAIYNPIIVKNKPVKCFLKAENKNQLLIFSIKSNALCFYCEAETGREKKIPRYDLMKAEKEITKSSIYSEYYSKNSLYLGPVFQNIDKALIDKDGNPFFVVDNSKLLPVLGLGIHDKLIQWIDILFQAVGAVALKDNFRVIPMKISKLSFFPETEISNYIYAIPSKAKFITDGIRGNAVLVNEKGEVILELIEISLKKIGEYKNNRLKMKKYKNG